MPETSVATPVAVVPEQRLTLVATDARDASTDSGGASAYAPARCEYCASQCMAEE